MQQVVRAYPVPEGKQPALREFAAALQGAKAAQTTEFSERHGVARESWHLQETSHGTWLIGVTEIPGKPVSEAARGYAESGHSFDA
jgi:hypothetical protein